MHLQELFGWAASELQGFSALGNHVVTAIAVGVLMVGLAQCVFGLRFRFIWAAALNAFAMRIVGGLLGATFAAGNAKVIVGVGLAFCAAGIAVSVLRPRIGASLLCAAAGFAAGYVTIGMAGGIVAALAATLFSIYRPKPAVIAATSLTGGVLTGFAVTFLMGKDWKVSVMAALLFMTVGLVVQTLLYYNQLQKEIFEYEDELVEEEIFESFEALEAPGVGTVTFDGGFFEGPSVVAQEEKQPAKQAFVFEMGSFGESRREEEPVSVPVQPAPVSQAPVVLPAAPAPSPAPVPVAAPAAPAYQPAYQQAVSTPISTPVSTVYAQGFVPQQPAYAPVAAAPQYADPGFYGYAQPMPQDYGYQQPVYQAADAGYGMAGYAPAMMPAQPMMAPGLQSCAMCGQQLPQGALYCGSCGTTAEQACFCPNCGEIASQGGFCGHCGFALR